MENGERWRRKRRSKRWTGWREKRIGRKTRTLIKARLRPILMEMAVRTRRTIATRRNKNREHVLGNDTRLPKMVFSINYINYRHLFFYREIKLCQ